MKGNTGCWVIAWLLASAAAATSAGAAIFFGGSYGWLESNIYKSLPTTTSPYLGGAGGSFEAGFDFGSISLSGELGPSYNQPARHIDAARAIGITEPGKYRLLLGNIRYRLEPIESVQPYLLLGGGQGQFTLDYGKGIVVGARRLTSERLKSWIVEAGFGFESPLRSWLIWGIRGRFLYNRWRATTDANRFTPYASGNAYSVDATLRIRL